MKKFFLKLFYLSIPFVFLGVLSIVFLVCFTPQYKYSYTAAVLDKIKLLEETPSPKIILCGNSNLAFGIESEMIEKKFNIPVVNLGFNGALGNAFHEEMVKYNLQKGDVVIICHTTYADDDRIGNSVMAWAVLENNFHLYKLIRKKDYIAMIFAFPQYIWRCSKLFFTKTGNEKPDGCYSRLAFNEKGDMIYPRFYRETVLNKEKVIVPEINDICINRLNKFYDYCMERGATCLIAGYPIFQREGEPIDTQVLMKFQKTLQEKVKIPVVSNYIDYIYDEHLFYDTFLHLTTEGAKIRTQQLCNDLERYFSK